MRTVALFGAGTVTELADRLRVAEADVRRVVGGLCERGLMWEHDGHIGLLQRLVEHFAMELAGFRPLSIIARQARVDQLREAIAALDGNPAGLPKPGLIGRLGELITEQKISAAVAGLPAPARKHLDLVLTRSAYHQYYGYGSARGADPVQVLVRAGLMLPGGGPPELPRETAALLIARKLGRMTGRPALSRSTDQPDSGRAAAEAAGLAVTTLLDAARSRPLAALKKGGIGTRERARISTKLGVPEPALWIDIAATAGLLACGRSGYQPTDDYDEWREQTPAGRWASIVLAWFELDHAPTSRETDDGEVPPPVPLHSTGGFLRRSLLRAAAGGVSVRSVASHIDWFCPVHGYDDTGRARKVDATTTEASLLGVIVGDRLSDLGELLVRSSDHPDARDELAHGAADLLPETRGLLVLQSDLTALVSGQPTAAAVAVLAAAATSESRGMAATWRFSPASVRAALDAGWSADALRAELVAASGRELPQPLDYLIRDVVRRHGAVRIRGARACVTGSEADVTEILNTRSLRPLHLSRIAPTVLASPFEMDDVLQRLRAAGFFPMAEDADGVVIVPQRPAASDRRADAVPRRPRSRIAAADLATRLAGSSGDGPPRSTVHQRIAKLAAHLDAAEIALLADALENGRDVRIHYRNRAGNRSVRDIVPRELNSQWLDAWCRLRADTREFSVSGIEAVSVVG